MKKKERNYDCERKFEYIATEYKGKEFLLLYDRQEQYCYTVDR